MSPLKLKARAKINLSLDVLGKRADGYHDLRMIMQTVELHDEVLLEPVRSGIIIECDSHFIPCGPENIAYKAASLILKQFGIDSGIKISIKKRIPVAAGLAGGSSDAAAVLKGINSIFSLGLDDAILMSIGKQIGADVPYCIKGGTMLSEGIGEILTELCPINGLDIVLIKPKINVSTAWVYKNLDLSLIRKHPDTELLINTIREKKFDQLANNMVNVLETVTETKYDIIRDIKLRMIEEGALGSMMSGSGPTVFGIFENAVAAKKAYDALICDKWECFLTKTICEER